MTTVRKQGQKLRVCCRIWLCLLPVFLLCIGCATNNALRIYLLAEPAQPVSEAKTFASLPVWELEPVRIPDYLDTTDILIRISAHEVKPSATAQWAERLSVGIAQALRGDLARRLHLQRVELDAPIDEAALKIYVTVDSLDMLVNGRCILVAHWTAGQVTGQQKFVSAAVVGQTDEQLVSTVSLLIDQLAAHIAERQGGRLSLSEFGSKPKETTSESANR